MMKESDQNEKAELNISLAKANFWFFILWLIMLFNYAVRMAINSVLPLLKQEFFFTDAQLGLISSIVAASISLLAPLAGMLADEWSRRKLISIMVAIATFATFATVLVTGYVTLILTRLGLGAGEAGYNPAGTALISTWYPKKVRGSMMGLFFSAVPLGTALGLVLTGFLAQQYGWRMSFVLLSIPGIVLAILVWFMPDYKTVKVNQAEGTTEKKGGALREALLFMLKSPSMILVYFMFAANAFSLMSLTTWGVTLFVRGFDLNIKTASMIVGIISLVGFIGSPFCGWLADQLVKRSDKGRIWGGAMFISIYFIAMTIFLQMSIPEKNLKLAVVLFTVSSFFVVGVIPCLYTVIQDLAAPSFRTTAAGFIVLIGSIFGAFPGPVVVGALSDKMGLCFAMQVVMTISVTCFLGLAFIVSIFFYRQDIERTRALGTFTMQQD
jgi:MFS family permease